MISGRAQGSYKVYTLDNTISSALLPQAWPRIVHRNLQTASGVPVEIEGEVPAGPVDLNVTIELRSSTGTPRAFAAL